MNWLLTKIISSFLLPPLCFLLPGIAGLALSVRHPRLGRRLIVLMMALLWIFSLPFTGDSLLRQLETGNLLSLVARPNAQAIVVLGGGTYFGAPELGGSSVSEASLERLRYAARLYRQSALPLLVTGGDPEKTGTSEAELMKNTLQQDFNVPVRWIEAKSDNTIENARYSRQMLGPSIKRIVLVTQGWHMPRARRLFERTGLSVIPAGTGFHCRRPLSLIDFIPSAHGLEDSSIFLHEAIGLIRDRLQN